MDGARRESENGSLLIDAPSRLPPVDPFSQPLHSIEFWNFHLLSALMFLVTSLSLFENFIVIYITVKFRQLRQPLNYVIVNLSVADFLVSLVGGTISFLTNLKGYFYMGRWACVLEGFAVTFFGIVALWSLALLAFERYVVICRPLGSGHFKGKHAALGIAFVWVFSLIWTIPPTVGWSSYTPSKIGTTCEPNWYSGEYNDHTFIITFFTTCFIMPLLVILGSYGKLMRKLRKVSDAQGRLGPVQKPERQVARMVVIMILAFLISWTPYAAFSILVTSHPSIELDPRLAAIPAFFSKTATVYNPVIYVFMNNQDPVWVGHQDPRFCSANFWAHRQGAPLCGSSLKMGSGMSLKARKAKPLVLVTNPDRNLQRYPVTLPEMSSPAVPVQWTKNRRRQHESDFKEKSANTYQNVWRGLHSRSRCDRLQPEK